jgi:hypothetical protein
VEQRNVQADSISYNGSTDTISDLRTYIASGNVVRADKTNDLINMMNSWDNHTHTYTDYYQLATYGNNGDRSDYTENKTTSVHNENSSDVGNVSVGETITAEKHNQMKTVVNKLRAHYHDIDDRTEM